MSEYPVWWDTTITIYNKYQNPQTDLITWYRTVVNNCFFKNAGNKVIVNGVTLNTDNILVRIPAQSNFKEYDKWIAVTNDQMSDYFTLHPGDIIVKGTVTDTINEYSAGHRSSDVLTKYKNSGICLVITKYQIDDGAGRCAKHYYVIGE